MALAMSISPLGDKIGTSDPAGGGLAAEPIDPDHGDLFFPKPFNDDQVSDHSSSGEVRRAVVQGPPGTGKNTHDCQYHLSHARKQAAGSSWSPTARRR